MVELYEHPTDKPTTRKVYRRDLRGWIYCMEFPRSKMIKQHDYMRPRWPRPKTQ